MQSNLKNFDILPSEKKQNITVILGCISMIYLQSLRVVDIRNSVISDNIDSILIISIFILIIYKTKDVAYSLADLTYNNGLNLLLKIMSLSTLFCYINMYLYGIIPEFLDLEKVYAPTFWGAFKLTLDMYHYTICNSLFGCSTIMPVGTLGRFINTIQLLLTYGLFIDKLVSNINSDGYRDKNCTKLILYGKKIYLYKKSFDGYIIISFERIQYNHIVICEHTFDKKDILKNTKTEDIKEDIENYICDKLKSLELDGYIYIKERAKKLNKTN